MTATESSTGFLSGPAGGGARAPQVAGGDADAASRLRPRAPRSSSPPVSEATAKRKEHQESPLPEEGRTRPRRGPHGGRRRHRDGGRRRRRRRAKYAERIAAPAQREAYADQAYAEQAPPAAAAAAPDYAAQLEQLQHSSTASSPTPDFEQRRSQSSGSDRLLGSLQQQRSSTRSGSQRAKRAVVTFRSGECEHVTGGAGPPSRRSPRCRRGRPNRFSGRELPLVPGLPRRPPPAAYLAARARRDQEADRPGPASGARPAGRRPVEALLPVAVGLLVEVRGWPTSWIGVHHSRSEGLEGDQPHPADGSSRPRRDQHRAASRYCQERRRGEED